MALEFVVDSIESVPETSRKFYTEKEGKFHLDEALSGEIKGLKSALDTEKNSAKERAKALKDYEAKYAGIDPDKSRKLQELMETNEEARLISEGKVDELVQKRTEKWRAEEDRQKQELNDRITAAEGRANAFKDRVLDDSFRAAAGEITDMHSSAVDEMLLGYLRTIFTLDDNGRAVQRNDKGEVILGKDGKTPYSPKEHLESLRSSKPWLFKVSSSGSPASGKQMQSQGKDFSNLPPVERLTAARAAAAQRRT